MTMEERDGENEQYKKFARNALELHRRSHGEIPASHWAWGLLGMCAEVDRLRDAVDPTPHIQQLRDQVAARMMERIK